MTNRLRGVTSMVVLGALLVGGVATGCSDDAKKSSATTSVKKATTTTEDLGVPSSKVDANNASPDQLLAAFERAEVPNAERWVEEVQLHRPYKDDNWAALRKDLDKADIDDDTFDKITSALTL